MNVLKDLFAIELYDIPRLCSLQYTIIVSKYLYMVKQNRSYFQGFYWNYYS